MGNVWVRHGLFWLFYWLLMGYIGGRYDLRFGRAFAGEAMQLPVRMALVYLVFARTPVLGKGNWWRWLGEVLGLLIAFTFVGRLLMYWVIWPWFYKEDYTMVFWADTRLLSNFLDMALTLFWALSLRFARQYMEFSTRQQQLQLEKTTAELHALRSQTNPHFLFNTLTNIYALARKNAPETADVVYRLSQLLRYMLYECTAPTIPVERELHMIDTYIGLEKLRFGHRLHVVGRQEMDDLSYPIPPLLLLPLFENAFKHGAGESRFSIDIDWNLTLQNGKLHFSISNSMEEKAIESASEPAGIGLQNVRKQLELLYPGKYRMDIREEAGRFRVEIDF